ncbi:MAG TPA: tRNA (N6-isopentenyl adenosine(37)-C2)-methylthiotransferase MiaB [Actinomycetes bacterium]|jgi:tRNA-2-methylthio-N6-dimethylallyladenosine synthase|nr:tRNA (N6-isopentenyl adenosine(37)-C2)-methylthiotransferase MiaB [Actinomycetes bacterium]
MSERYLIRTFGCQMNEHDSERIAGLLEADGMRPAAGLDDADLVVLNTCAVRENADNKLYGALGHLAATKAERGLVIAVGGCLAQKDQGRVLAKAPWVDVVFGTHNIGSLPVLLRRASEQGVAQAEFFDEMQAFPSALPARRDSDWSAWVAISVGCNNTCTFCIVPMLRGKERSRRVGDVLAEVQALAGAGVVEVTLLGQNVNSYGTDLPGHRQLFGELLRALDGVDGLERLRFTSPNPKDFRDDVVDAMASCRPLADHVHFPLQSGSDRVLRLMRRGYRRRRYLEILGKIRAAMPGVAFSTDVIVGFPGETEADFADTLEVVERAGFDSAFMFQYSPRPGTEAASMPEQIPPEVVRDRFSRLVDLQERISLERNQALVGTEVELLVELASSKTNRTRMSGRTGSNKLCHFPVAGGVAPGDFVTVRVEQAAPHHLLGGRVLAHRPRRVPAAGCGAAPPPRPLPAGAVPLPLVG